jgi:hypothetical protein
VRRKEPHEPSNDCNADHCYSHMVDEPGSGYLLCGECGHLYRTKGELRRAYRREFLRINSHGWFGMERLPRWKVWWKILTIREKDIYFCQHCIHDF